MRREAALREPRELALEDRARAVRQVLAVVVDHVAQHQGRARQPGTRRSVRQVGPDHEVAVALVPGGGLEARDRLHLHVDGEQVVAGVPLVAGGLEEEAAGDPLADQPALHVGEGGDHRVDLAARDLLLELLEVHHARHPAPSAFCPPPTRARMPRPPPGQPEIPPPSCTPPGDRAWRSSSASSPSSCSGRATCSSCLRWRPRRARRRPRRWAGAALAAALGLALLVDPAPRGRVAAAPAGGALPAPRRLPRAGRRGGRAGRRRLPEITAARGDPAFGETGERYMALLELARRYPEARVVFTGGVGRLGGGVPPEAEAVRLLLARHGLEGRVLLEDRARTTRENARDARRAGAPRPGRALAAGHLGRRTCRARWACSAPPAGRRWYALAGRLPHDPAIRPGLEPPTLGDRAARARRGGLRVVRPRLLPGARLDGRAVPGAVNGLICGSAGSARRGAWPGRPGSA